MTLLSKAIVRRVMAVALVVAMLAGGLPSFAGVLILSDTPAFTMDICHPLPSLDNSPMVSLPAILPSRHGFPALAELGYLSERTVELQSALAQPPDPPPPKPVA